MITNQNWQPTASLANLQFRAKVIDKIRAFFAKRNVLEVETPLLASGAITDPNIHSFTTAYESFGDKDKQNLYLQTSPEFAMKRLLAAGYGSIYQICKAFRNGEFGSRHNPEFTMLEWYRVGFDHHALMAEIGDFLQFILNSDPAGKLSYAEAFQKYLQIDPLEATFDDLRRCAIKRGLNDLPNLDRDGWLDLLLVNFIEPKLGIKAPTFIYDYPISQAALAKVSDFNSKVAERFELYINGIELANGFHELADAKEQKMRFMEDLKKRKKLGLPPIPIDENFIAGLAHGLPDCAGVALGVDRLLMVMKKTKSIKDIMAYTFANA